MKPVLVCLHGWGGSKTSWTELRAALEDDSIEILTPDLPGFGDQAEPDRAWTVDDYADWTEAWIRKHVSPLRPFHLAAHSHGGRIALTLAARGSVPLLHLYLCAGAGVSRPAGIRRTAGLALAKTGKAVLALPGLRALQPIGKRLLYKILRVHDYEKASPVMRASLAQVVAQDLRPLLPEVRVPTDIFWGTEDRLTPYKDAGVLQDGIRGSILHTFPGVRHRVHRDKAADIASVIRMRLAEAA